jgi:hypothetical protein
MLITKPKTICMEHFFIFSGALCVLTLLVSILSMEPIKKTNVIQPEENQLNPLQTVSTEENFNLEQPLM